MQNEPYAAPPMCACNCGGEVRRARYPSQQPRFIHGHNGRGECKPPCYIVEDRGYVTPCWVWQNARSSTGYGDTRNPDTGRRVGAHRYFYERAKGPIPAGLELDHLCRNPACVNPDHLEAVTGAVNVQRSSNAKLTRAQVEDIRCRRAAGERVAALAEEFGVTPTHVYFIVKGKTWGAPGIRSKAA